MSASHHHRVLVVEDDYLSRSLLVDVLEHAGYYVGQAEDGAVALSILRADPSFDLVLLDMQMPKIDGLSVARTMRAEPALQRIPIIALTAIDTSDAVVEMLRSGCTAYLAKPISIADVRQMVAGTLLDHTVPPSVSSAAPASTDMIGLLHAIGEHAAMIEQGGLTAAQRGALAGLRAAADGLRRIVDARDAPSPR